MTNRPLSAACAACLAAVLAIPAFGDDYDAASRKLATPGWVSLKAQSFDVAQGEPVVAPHLRALPVAGDDVGYWLVKVRGPVQEAHQVALRAQALEPVDFVQVDTFIARGTAAAAQGARGLPGVTWVGAFQPAYKLDPTIGTRTFTDGRDAAYVYLNAEVWAGESVAAAARQLARAGADVIQVWDDGLVRRIRCRAIPALLPRLAHLREVKFLEEVGEITLRNNNTTWVAQTNVSGSRTVWDKGIHGEGQVAGHIDGRIDRNHCNFIDPANNTPGPTHRKLVGYHSSTGFGSDSHGTHTAGTTAGDQSYINPGNFNGNGHAWAARISHSNVDDITGSGTQTSNLAQYLTTQHNEGARAHTNSWGDDGTTQYTTWCVDVDAFSRQNEDSLVVFAETNQSGAVRTPENAKDCLAVGLTNPPPNQGQKAWGGSAPTSDGRRKPEIFAPGSNTSSADNNTACSFVGMGGTSMASPAINGNALLVRQYYSEGWYPTGTKVAADAFTPTGALLKATLMNGTVDMTGISGYPSNGEGWGRLLLENALHFSGDTRKLLQWDVRNATGLATGGVTEYNVDVDAATEGLRVTVAFTDPPASLLASLTPINNLDLEVETPTGTIYLGNVFNTGAGESQAGGSADALNNVENVLVKAPAVGAWKVRVKGANVPQGPQGYALVVTGAVSLGAGQPPVANFSGTPTSGPAPLAVAFTDLSTNAPTSWSWTFGDGGTSTTQSPSHTYTAAGTYTVGLTATNAFGSDTETKTAYITVTGASFTTEEVITGAGTGQPNPNLVKTWNHASPPAQVAAWNAYAAGQWGVNVASGDIDAGGSFEVLTGPGPGPLLGPQVRGFQGNGTAISKVNFYAYGTLRYGVHVGAGDLDGDVHDEILTTPGPGAPFGPHVRGWNYDGAAVTSIAKLSFFAYSTLRYGCRIAGGDTDADGFAEIVTGAAAAAVFAPHVRVFNYDNGAGGCTASFFAFPTGSYGASVATGDTDADGAFEVLVGRGPDPAVNAEVRGFDVGPACGVASAWSVTPPFGTLSGAEPAGGDVDADGQDEVAIAPGAGVANTARVMLFEISGAGGTAIPGQDFTAYAGLGYGARVALGDTGTP